MAAALIMIGAAAVGCSRTTADPQTDGPLLTGGDSGRLCVPIGKQTEATIAFDNLRTTEPVTIDRVRFVSPEQVRLVSVELMPILHRTSLGVWPGYPPREALSTKISWDQREPATGSELQPDDPRMELVLRVQLEAAVGTVQAVSIEYTTESGQAYLAETTTSFELREGRSCRESSA